MGDSLGGQLIGAIELGPSGAHSCKLRFGLSEKIGQNAPHRTSVARLYLHVWHRMLRDRPAPWVSR